MWCSVAIIASLVSSDDYLLRCYRYIELSPVTARMVDKLEEYRWSSYHFNGAGRDHAAAHQLFTESLSDDVHEIRGSLSSNHVLGNSGFREYIESQPGRKISSGKRGWPYKK